MSPIQCKETSEKVTAIQPVCSPAQKTLEERGLRVCVNLTCLLACAGCSRGWVSKTCPCAHGIYGLVGLDKITVLVIFFDYLVLQTCSLELRVGELA